MPPELLQLFDLASEAALHGGPTRAPELLQLLKLLICYLLSAICYLLLAIGYLLLAIGYWLLAIGYWLLAIGYSRSASPQGMSLNRSSEE
jgi:hypothetical protein